MKDYMLESAFRCGSEVLYLLMGNSKGVKMSVLLCLLLWSLVEVHSQTEFPYVSFMGETLPNHSYVQHTREGRPDDPLYSHDIVCHTDLATCCSTSEGSHRGHWYFPDGTGLPHDGFQPIVEVRSAQQVALHPLKVFFSSPFTSGIYRCDIPTNDNDIAVKETVYVGVYATGGIYMI